MAQEDWGLDDPGYSPSRFYTRHSDKQGHSVNLRVHVPKYIAGRIQAVFESRHFPYKTLGDFFCDAIFHRLYALEHELYPFEQQDGLAMMAVREQVERLRTLREEAQRTIDEVEGEVRALVAAGEEGQAKEIVASTLAAAPENLVARRFYLRLCEERFRGWVE